MEHVISVTCVGTLIHFRTYSISLSKVGLSSPRVELQEMGPSFDFTIGRVRYATPETEKESKMIPQEVRPKKEKNVSRNELGEQFGRVHLGKQDLSGLQTRKMKGLKRKRNADAEE
jgi:ribosome production factor 2